MKNLYYFTLSLTMIGILQSSHCGTSKSCDNPLQFEIPFVVTPQDTFRIGDTIWVASKISDTLLDKNTGQLIRTDNFDLSTEMVVGRIDTSLVLIAASYFTIIESTGQVRVLNSGAFQTKFDTSGKEQKIKFGLVPKKTGVFGLAPYSIQQNSTNPIQITHSECRDIITMSYRTNNGQCNYHILKRSKVDTLTEPQYIAEGVYGFEVIKR